MSKSEVNSFVAEQCLACECGETFEDEDTFEVHVEQNHSRQPGTRGTKQKKAPPPIIDYKCGECGKVYQTEEECVEHQEIDHIPYMEEWQSQNEVEDDVEDSIIADVIFPSTSRSPSISSGVTDSTEKKKKKRDQRKKVQCELCGKNYSSNAALWYHRKIHLGLKPFKCTYCPKAFTLKLYLQMHIRTHTGEKPYQCANCPKAFSNRGALLRHDLVHTGIKPYQCPKCGKSFTQSNAMKLHYHTVHLKLPTPYKHRRTGTPPVSREKKAKVYVDDGDERSQVQYKKTEVDDQPSEEVCYMRTPSGRQIALTTIVPKKLRQEIKTPTVVEETDAEDVSVKCEPADNEVYYYISDPGMEGDDVAYEVVYE